MICPLSPAAIFGFAAFHVYAVLLLFERRLAPLPLLAFLMACAIAPFLPGLGFFLPIVSRGKRGERGVALTFDDGPDPEITQRVLKTLDEHNACATFFVRGDNAERHPELLKEIAVGGHEIGNHSYSHEPVSSVDAAKEELRKTEDAIREATGRDVRLFRPPRGVRNCELTRQALKAGYVVVTWTISSADSRPIGPDVIASNVIHTPNPGDIVIMHDGEGHAATTDALPKVLDALEKKGYRFVTLPELMGEWDRWLTQHPKGASRTVFRTR